LPIASIRVSIPASAIQRLHQFIDGVLFRRQIDSREPVMLLGMAG
jgi:hypothetical protein